MGDKMNNNEIHKKNYDYNLNSVLEMVMMLYPDKPIDEETIVECREKFYEKENILPKLEYLNKNMDEIFKKSEEEHRQYLFHILIIRMKELYCNCEQYEQAFDMKKASVASIFDNFINNVYKIEPEDIPLIINEAYARLKVNNTIDEQMYNVIRKINEEDLDNIVLFSDGVNVYQNENKNIYVGYEKKFLVYVLVELCKMLALNNEIEILEKFVFITVDFIYDYYEYELYCEDLIISDEDILNQFIEIKNICKNANKFIQKVIDFYTKAFKIISINAEHDEVILVKTNAEEVKKCFLEVTKSLNNKLMNKYWDNIRSLSYRYMNFDDNIVESCENFFLQSMIEVFNKKSSISNLKKMLEELILKSGNIPKLFNLKEYKYIVQIYDENKNNENITLTRFYFEIAFSLSKNDRKNEAKNIYEIMVDNEKAGSAVYNNLGVIYEQNKEYNKALYYYQKSNELNPNDKISMNNIENIKATLKELEEKPKKMKELYFKKIRPWHRKILFAIYRLSNNDEITIQDLGEITKQSTDNVEKNINYLINMGMVYDNGLSFSLDTTIEQMVGDYIDPKLERQIVKVDNTKLYRPIFYHESEIFMYKALLELFPQHLVFPNMSLKTIFDIDKMKELLDTEDIKYLFMAHVDFVIINTSSYFPVLAFEKDSSYNDTDYAKERSEKKNLIFRTGGIPLIRLKFNSGMEYEKLKADIRDSTKSMILEYSEENTYEVDFKKEFDAKRFGINNSPIDLEIIKSGWEATVGKGIAQKSKIIDVENGKLLIEISLELKAIIEISEVAIKQKLFDKYDFLKEIEFIWY